MIGLQALSLALEAGAARVHVVHNWGWEPADAAAPDGLTDLIRGDALPQGAPLPLGPWDVRVLAAPLTSKETEA